MISVRSNWPVSCALIRKYVDNSIGHRTPCGTYANEPSLKTALFRPAKKLSLKGTTVPRYFLTRSGCSWTASENEQKMIPSSASRALNVVATETLSRTASTATPARRSCSISGIPLLETIGGPPVFEKRNVDYNVVIYIFGRTCGE